MSQYEVFCEGGERFLGLRWLYADQAKALRAKGYIVVLA
jgi:hypothetical protein